MALSVDLEKRNKQQAQETCCRGETEKYVVRLEWVMRIEAGRRRILGDARKNRCADSQSSRHRQFDDRLKN